MTSNADRPFGKCRVVDQRDRCRDVPATVINRSGVAVTPGDALDQAPAPVYRFTIYQTSYHDLASQFADDSEGAINAASTGGLGTRDTMNQSIGSFRGSVLARSMRILKVRPLKHFELHIALVLSKD